MKIQAGKPYPLGATWDGSGSNFSLFSEHATAVELCLFGGRDGKEEMAKIPMTEKTDLVWHAYLPEVGPGQRYGYRVHGPYEPEKGHRFNPAKLLLDPYAKAIDGTVQWSDVLFGYDINHPEGDLRRDERDSSKIIPKSIVIDSSFSWDGDMPLNIPWHETIIYEAHVKGLTIRHPDIPQELRGTYAGLAHPVMIDYLKGLGITAVELMPVHHFVTDRPLAERGLTNYWGYNSIGFFAPDVRYSSSGTQGQQISEFKSMVKALHQAGIEIILDVVFNHTAEGNHLGPTLCFRGIDNTAYYRLVGESPRHYMDYTGTGNTLNMAHPKTLQLMIDSLRYWVMEMHVDGFRFDLAAALAKVLQDVDCLKKCFDMLHQDPVISKVKLIAEPWDVGPGGYQVGNFPAGWAEWNGKYRDTVRDYWRGIDRTIQDFAYRLTGSSDLYESSGRRPCAGINFVTAHDGFTLHDQVSYNEKHNEANGEGNRDGESHNRSWNCGIEGKTDDPAINALRNRQKRNFLATLLLSQGIPMLLGGDEFGRTQQGNNNAYCQDNEISWLVWENTDKTLLDFTRSLIRFRMEHPVFLRHEWFQGRPIYGGEGKDIGWYRPDGMEMSGEDWNAGVAKSLGVLLNGKAIPASGAGEKPVEENCFYLLFNSNHEMCTFALPKLKGFFRWIKVLDTQEPVLKEGKEVFSSGDKIPVESRSLVVLSHTH